MALSIATIIDSISGITVSNVTIKDLNEIPNAVDGRTSLLFPRPNDFVTGFKITGQNMGQDTGRKYDVDYDLNYVLCAMPVGAGRGLFDATPTMVERAFAIVDACLADNTITGAVGFDFKELSNVGVMVDPSGNSFYGCIITFHILEFVN